GDLLYQIIFHTRIAKEKGYFSIVEVIEGIYEKLVKRHPHVFGKERVRGAKRVIEAWHRRKLKESENSVFNGIPKILPALHKAEKIQHKLSLLGYDFGNLKENLEKIEKDWEELKKKLKRREQKKQIEKKIGFFLFNIVNLARILGIEPETVLHETTNKLVKTALQDKK
ncbi:MAG: MazG nucleotide pyrophosphohydrolase domain-containing protein, partial [Candidatus Omnitrophota bacterium]